MLNTLKINRDHVFSVGKDPVEKYIFIVFGAAILLLIIICGESFLNLTRIIENYLQVSRSHDVIVAIKNLQSKLTETEKLQEEFCYDQDANVLRRYQSNLNSVREYLPQLYRLTRGNPGQQAGIQKLDSLLTEKQRISKIIMNLSLEIDFDQNQFKIVTQQERMVMYDIQSHLSRIELSENILYQNLQNKSINEARRIIIIISLGAALAVIVMVFSLVHIKIEISKRKNSTEDLQSAHFKLSQNAAELEAVNEDLTQYAYVVSHDIKAPLRAIRNYADFLKEDLHDLLNEAHQEYMCNMHKAISQGEKLVEDVLKFSSIGMHQIEWEKVDLNELISELVDSFQLPPGSAIEAEEKWPTIDSEPTMLRQLLHNLIDNGLKFNESEQKTVQLGWNFNGSEFVEIHVQDNGIGIDNQFHKRIFGAFQRLHAQSEYRGTGIGLAIVKKAVSKLNGQVKIKSAPGEGTLFTITLPLIP